MNSIVSRARMPWKAGRASFFARGHFLFSI